MTTGFLSPAGTRAQFTRRTPLEPELAMLGLGVQEVLVLLVIGLVPLIGVVAVLFLVLRSRRADNPGRD